MVIRVGRDLGGLLAQPCSSRRLYHSRQTAAQSLLKNLSIFYRVMWTDWESSRHICQSLLEAKEYSRLVDFDSHLDDIRQDWTNQQLNTEIAQLVSVANGSV
uniref:Uncharacterized protein n=1 Tax=Micrurus paraensis TaxID=1970185 RepID=A0A2D4K1W1_9SAUR